MVLGIKKTIKRIIVPALVLVMAVTCMFMTGCGEEKKEPKDYGDSKQYGLHAEDGYIYLNGELFYGMGMNWHGGVNMGHSRDVEHLDRYFGSLRDGGIPFVRTMIGFFYSNQIPNYLKDKEKFYEGCDLFVQKAEEYRVGIIFSLNWNYSTFCSFVGETRDKIADPYSKGNALLKQYVKEVVTRYKDSPAVWGWEIGNEGNLDCDLSTSTIKGTDLNGEMQFTSDMTGLYYGWLSDYIRKLDPYRMITNGDGGYRGAWKALKLSSGRSWFPADTEEDYQELYRLMSQGSIDTLSVHYLGVSEMKRFNERAREMGLAYFLGEFHSTEGFTKGYDDPNFDAANASWQGIKDAIIDADIQIAANWCYGRCIEQFADGTSVELGWINNPQGEPHYQNLFAWDGAVEMNKYYVENGKSKAAEYWENAECLFYKG